MEQRFCSDPAPSRVTWQWQGQRLQAGHARGRYSADDVTQVCQVRSDVGSGQDRSGQMSGQVSDRLTSAAAVRPTVLYEGIH